MKFIFLTCLIITSIQITFSKDCTSFSEKENKFGQESHGGDIAVSIFMGVAKKIEDRLSCIEDKELPSTKFKEEYSKAFLLTKIYSVEKTELNGNEVDAINYPDANNPQIFINRKRWLDVNYNFYMRALLVIHEYLSIMGYDDSRYMISYPLAEKLSETKN